jgi:hypothetical protein
MIQLKTANNFITHCLDDVADVLKGREKLDLKNTIDNLADRMEEHQNHMGFLLEANELQRSCGTRALVATMGVTI